MKRESNSGVIQDNKKCMRTIVNNVEEDLLVENIPVNDCVFQSKLNAKLVDINGW